MDNRAIIIRILVLFAFLLAFSAPVFSQTCTYDALNRLTSVDYGNGNVVNYTYDASGNRLTENVTGTRIPDDTPSLSVLPSATQLPYAESTPTMQVSNAGSGTLTWTASVVSGQSWLTITSGSSGVGTGTVTMLATLNPGSLERNATVRIVAPGATNDTQDIVFNQDGNPSISDVPTERIADRYALMQNQPNPFNPSTIIQYSVPEDAVVELAIYDLSGRLVRTLVNRESHSQGWYEERWNGMNNHGQRAATGIYLYRIKAGSYVETRRMTLMK